MTYIAADGTVHPGKRPTLKASVSQARESHPILFGLLAILVGLAIKNLLSDNPLANGKIPASDTAPNEHWDRIAKDDTLMKRLADSLEGQRDVKLENDLKVESGSMEILFDRVDFGGAEGHRYESKLGDMEDFRGTRCSSTRSAVTAYFCGAQVAMNQNVALKEKRKPQNYGVDSFRGFINCRYEQGNIDGNKNHNMTRSVFRLGIGCQEPLAGYSHAWSIVAQPDGTYMWLQSYISQYSLQTWMAQTNDKTIGTIRGKLSHEQLLEKLDRLDRIMSIDGWTDQANEDYLDLFFVDKNLEAMKRGMVPVAKEWKPAHRLDYFVWDEACEYPLPPTEESGTPASDEQQHEGQDPTMKKIEEETSNDTAGKTVVVGTGLDRCHAQALLKSFDEIVKLKEEMIGLETSNW